MVATEMVLRDPHYLDITVELVTLGKPDAITMLGDVKRNRGLRRPRIDGYTRQMVERAWWEYVGDPIMYDTNGLL